MILLSWAEGIILLAVNSSGLTFVLKSQYLRANLEHKAKMLKILLSNCELKGVSTSFQWNKPFDVLFEMRQTGKWGE